MLRLALAPVLWMFKRLLEPLLFLVLTFAMGAVFLDAHGATALTGFLFLAWMAVLSIVFNIAFGR